MYASCVYMHEFVPMCVCVSLSLCDVCVLLGVCVSVCTYIYVRACMCLAGEKLGGSVFLAEYGQKRQHMERSSSRKNNGTFE